MLSWYDLNTYVQQLLRTRPIFSGALSCSNTQRDQLVVVKTKLGIAVYSF